MIFVFAFRSFAVSAFAKVPCKSHPGLNRPEAYKRWFGFSKGGDEVILSTMAPYTACHQGSPQDFMAWIGGVRRPSDKTTLKLKVQPASEDQGDADEDNHYGR